MNGKDALFVISEKVYLVYIISSTFVCVSLFFWKCYIGQGFGQPQYGAHTFIPVSFNSMSKLCVSPPLSGV